MGRAGIVLERYDNKFIAELGRSVIPMMSSGFSKMGMAALFVLAYHLKKPGRWSDDYLLPDASQLEEFADNRYEEYSDRVISVCGPIQTITATHKYNAAKEASVYAYVAASMLRLFTKSPSNYIRAFNHIVDGYSRFYGEPADVQLPTPAEAAMRTLSDCKDRERRMWRYGRVFDETFMADIQTKTCPKLVYIMAAALQFEDPKTNMGILDIVQLGDVSPENQVLCKEAATRLLRMIKMTQAKEKDGIKIQLSGAKT
ncbi:hypothetical protein Syun_030293 [Stephania yunnanensis]|uniref:Uncharacterized protein n=1 Tax=Stephania yunnanensis TaxID=152371 RepID=A0AAP0HI39_9MAGN